MLNDDLKQSKRTWAELVAAAEKETDPEKIAGIAEEIFAALEERERRLPQGRAGNSSQIKS